MHIVAHPAGRLVTFRIVLPVSDDNSGRASADLRATIVGLPGAVVVVSDLREARTFSPETTERFVLLMKADNPKIERSALLVHDSPTLAMQLQRMLKEAAHPSRRAFSESHALREWLRPSLTPDEQIALDLFLP